MEDMKYPKKIVKLPADMVVGSEIGIVGEGWDDFTITGIDKDASGDVTGVHISSGWREPLCKIYLLRGRNHAVAAEDPTSWIDVQIGECDICGKKFKDCCVYHYDKDDNKESMVCTDCHTKGDLTCRLG
jgi:hypothetical protein